MSDNNIEEILRNCRPVVKDNPSFVLETLRKMDAVEGIKEEVDRQHRHGRSVIFVALFLGLLAGILVTAIPHLFPEAASAFAKALRGTAMAIPYFWRLFITTSTILAVTLCLVLPLERRGRES